MGDETLVPVSARVPPRHKDAIHGRASRAGTSASEYLASVIEAHLERDPQQDLIDALSDLKDELHRVRDEQTGLRNDLATVLELVLLNVANLPEQEVERVVSNVLRKRNREPEDA